MRGRFILLERSTTTARVHVENAREVARADDLEEIYDVLELKIGEVADEPRRDQSDDLFDFEW